MNSKINIDQKFGIKCITIAEQKTENTIFLNNLSAWERKVRTKITKKELIIRIDIDTEKIEYLVYTLEDIDPPFVSPHGLEHYEIFDNREDAIKYYNEVKFSNHDK